MNEMINGAAGLASAAVMAALVIIGLVAWFFINRASVKANQQIQLLEALLHEQKQQNALLRRLSDAVVGKDQAATAASDADGKDFNRLIPER